MEKFLEKKYYFNNPITLQKSLLKNKTVYITPKLDGRRYLVYLHPKTSYRINTLLEKEILDIKASFKAVLDVEFYKNKYYVFDILYYKNKDIRYLLFSERLKILQSIKDLLPKNFTLKIFENIEKDKICDYIHKTHKETGFKTGALDGVIINNNSHYYSKIYKYKPPHMLSIDFRIKKKEKRGLDLYIDDKNTMKKFTETIITPYQYRKYNDNTIVEFEYDFKNNRFTPLRERPDKVKSNSLKTVKSNYKEIINPSFVC